MNSNQIRTIFTDFFVQRDHILRPGGSLIPNDPTLLLTNAGMVPFKPYFLGEETPPFPRATSVQRSARTIDIDIIGTTTRHFSFFEMLGNFSFGDYFKTQAIPWAFELVTTGFGLDPDRLWFTVYETDDEAAQIWVEQVEVPSVRVQRGGKDNFWQMGIPGPCGPCSEIFYDRGPEYGPEGGPIDGGEERYVEIWNLVFMQNIQDQPYQVVGELPAKSIDTGMGLERMAMIQQNVPSIFDIDVVRPVLAAGESFCGKTYGADPMTDVSLRILADHGRTMTFLIGDGVVPSNEGRGYILRRIIRRAVRHAWQLGGKGLITPQLVLATAEVMQAAYPHLWEQRNQIEEMVSREEVGFRRTLESGHQLLDSQLSKQTPGSVLSGQMAFTLHDTYGFPVELTTEIAAERGFSVDQTGFDQAMQKQREQSRQSWSGAERAAGGEVYRTLLDQFGFTDFVGYDHATNQTQVLAMMRNGEGIQQAVSGEEVEVFLAASPFYAEAGGQVGDQGLLTTPTGQLQVNNTVHALNGLYAHCGRITRGTLTVGQPAETAIDSPRRERIRKSHTGTHLLHWGLREVLGDNARQAGSLVEAGRLRFDFSFHRPLSEPELVQVEELTNQAVVDNSTVSTTLTSTEQAIADGALAFFGDKYGEEVRVVTVGGSKELCGGTHVPSAGQVGPVVVLGESSIGANQRRVEALTGIDGFGYFSRVRDQLRKVAARLRTSPEEVPERVSRLLDRIDQLEEQEQRDESADLAERAKQLISSVVRIGEYQLLVESTIGLKPNQLRELALLSRNQIDSGIVVLGAEREGKGALVGVLTPDLLAKGISAGELLSEAAAQLGGGGSRDPELAQAGGPQGDQLSAALAIAQQQAYDALFAL